MTHPPLALALALAAALFAASSHAAPVAVANPGFEDTTGQSVFNEFTFGVPAGWALHDPEGVAGMAGTYTGTLQPNGVDFFTTSAPEGQKVAILFNSASEGAGEYGYVQTLGDTLLADTSYTLTARVGNIASGTAEDMTFFDLDEFPGYRVELLAGGVPIAVDDDSLAIPEGTFATATVALETGAAHPQLGQTLGIRLVNKNLVPAGYTPMTSPDLEVDFDDVSLDAAPVPEPARPLLIACGASLLSLVSRARSARRGRS